MSPIWPPFPPTGGPSPAVQSGGGGVGTDPPSIFGANLISWWKPDSGIGGLGIVSDLANGANLYNQASAATINSSWLAGQPGWSFSAASVGGLATGASATPQKTLVLGAGVTTVTIWSVFQFDSSSQANARIFSMVNNAAVAGADYLVAGSLQLQRTTTGIFGLVAVDATNTFYNTTGFDPGAYNTPIRFIGTYNNGPITMWINGVSIGSASPVGGASLSSANWFSIGNEVLWLEHSMGLTVTGAPSSSAINGIIGDTGVAKVVASTPQIAALDLYLKNKYGL